MSDPEILADLLGDSKTDRTLDEMVNFIAQKEQGKATRNAVGDSTNMIRHTIPPKFQKSNAKIILMANVGPAGVHHMGKRTTGQPEKKMSSMNKHMCQVQH